MNKKGVWTGIIVIVVILIITGFYQKSKTATSGESIKIGGAFILSGPQALVGTLQKNAATMAVEEINAAGGINSRPVELILEDSTFDTKVAIAAYESLKLRGVRYIIADGSPVVSSIRPAAVKDGNLVFTVGATTPGYFDNSNLSCRIALTAKNFGPGFSELLKKKGYSKVVMLLPDNEYGKGLHNEFSKAFVASSTQILATEFYDATPSGGDYRTNITKLKAIQKDTDTLIVVQVSNTVEVMLKQLKELGWNKPIVSDYYMINNPALKDINLVNGIDFVDYQYSRDTLAGEPEVATKFKADYSAKYGSSPVFLAAGHYDVTKILAQAIEKVGDDPQKVADYISSIQNYKGVTGNLSFNDDCEVSRDIVFRTVKDGKIVDMK